MASHNSVYHQAFTELYTGLVNCLKFDYTDLTDGLFSALFFSENTREEVFSERSKTNGTRKLLDVVLSKIKEDPKNFHKFLEVLDLSKNPVYENVAKKLQNKVQSIQNIPCLQTYYSGTPSPQQPPHLVEDITLRENVQIIQNTHSPQKVEKPKAFTLSVSISLKGALGLVVVLVLIPSLYTFSTWYGSVTSHQHENDVIQCHIGNDQSKGAIDTYTKAVEIGHNLPHRSSPFFGREHDIANLTKSLLKQNRIININGPPAFGKSSLAIKIGWTLMENYSATFKEVRYIDTETTKSSIYLCSKRSYNSQSQKVGNSKSVITLNDTDSPHQSDTEPNLCEWSKNRPHKTLLILDNCDFVLCTKQQDFVNVLNDQFDRCGNIKNNLSIIITSQEKLFFLDDCFESFPIAELDPTDSASMLNHYVPNIDSEIAHNFSSLVGHCPLALKVVGRLLAARGIGNVETLLLSLENKIVSTISDKVADTKKRFKAIMDLAYTNLDIESQECSLIVSLFPSTFESTIGGNILSGIIDLDCIEEVVQKSIIEEYSIAAKTRYTMQKIVRSYFTEIHGRDPFRQSHVKHFETNFISSYSNYLLQMLKDRHKFKNVTEEEVYRVFYLENSNLEHFFRIILMRKDNLTDENVLAFSFLIIENILNRRTHFEGINLAFTHYLSKSRHLHSKLCQFSSHDICSQFAQELLIIGSWQTIRGQRQSSNQRANSPFISFWTIYWRTLVNRVPIKDIHSCETLSIFTYDTFSKVAPKIEKMGGQFDVLILRNLSTLICRAKQIIGLRILFVIGALIIFLFMLITMMWFYRVSFSFSSLSIQHLIICCIVYLLDSCIDTYSIVSSVSSIIFMRVLDIKYYVCCIVYHLDSCIDTYSMVSSMLSVLNMLVLDIIYFFILFSLVVASVIVICCICRDLQQGYHGFVMFFSNTLLTMNIQILFLCNEYWYSFYTHLILSLLLNFWFSNKNYKQGCKCVALILLLSSLIILIISLVIWMCDFQSFIYPVNMSGLVKR